MFHNQKKYNCPVKFWMGLDYPSSPPICYVSPTRDMGIKPRHVHVDNAGFIYHLYLTQWNVRSSLKELCSTLTTVFSKDPPVFAKPQGGQGASHPPSQQQSSSQPQQQVQPSPQLQPAQTRPVSQPERPPPASAGNSHPPPQQPPSQASSRPPPNPSSAAAGVAGGGGATQPAAGSWSGGGVGGWATGPLSAAAGNVEEESKESLISFVMSKINVLSPPTSPCAPIYEEQLSVLHVTTARPIKQVAC